MDKELTYIEKLDEILIFLCNVKCSQGESCFKNEEDIINELPNSTRIKSKFHKDELFIFLIKLESDKYIYKTQGTDINRNAPTDNPNKQHFRSTYRITIDGILFVKDGGYYNFLKKQASDDLRQENLNTLEMRLKVITKKQNYWLVAIGLVAALYYLIELLKVIYHHKDKILDLLRSLSFCS